jgi:hypothetical protein
VGVLASTLLFPPPSLYICLSGSHRSHRSLTSVEFEFVIDNVLGVGRIDLHRSQVFESVPGLCASMVHPEPWYSKREPLCILVNFFNFVDNFRQTLLVAAVGTKHANWVYEIALPLALCSLQSSFPPGHGPLGGIALML